MAARRARGRRNEDPRKRIKEGQDKSDNKTAMQALLIGVGAIVLIFGFIAMAKDDPKPTKTKKKRNQAAYQPIDSRPEMPETESSVPMWLTSQFLIRMAEENLEKMGELIWWDELFRRIDEQNNRDEGQRYADLDEAGKEALREKFLFKVIDPEFVEIVRKYLLEDLLAGETDTMWETNNVGANYGNIALVAKDERARPLLVISIKTELMDGYDTVRDAQNRDAWRIISVAHEQRLKMKDGRPVRARRKDFGEKFYKKPRKKKKRGPVGPPEADPTTVAWLAGTSAEMQNRVSELVRKVVDLDNPRDGDDAKAKLSEVGKTAIPGVLNGIAALDYKEGEDGTNKTFQLVQVLREITGINWNYRAGRTGLGFGRGGMTRSTPEERERAIRRWFGWWQKSGPTWTKKEAPQEGDESWDDLIGEEEDEGKKG